MAKNTGVPRPLKRNEYQLKFGSTQAHKGWRDLTATIRGPLTDTWDFLTRTPTNVTPFNYPLKGELSTITRNGVGHQRWQHKPTQKGSARIWFYVDGRSVVLEQVHTAHPNETK